MMKTPPIGAYTSFEYQVYKVVEFPRRTNANVRCSYCQLPKKLCPFIDCDASARPDKKNIVFRKKWRNKPKTRKEQ